MPVRLLVAALDSELVAFPAEVPGFDRLVTGIGKLRGALALARALDARDYDEVVVVGTAGVLDPAMPSGVHDVVAAIQHDVADLDGVVGQHVSLPARVAISPAPGSPVLPARDTAGVVIATGDRFIDDADAVVLIRGLGAQLVDMETYAYAWVAAEAGVPLRVLKAISDNAQDGATTSWDDAVAGCSAELWDVIRRDYLGD